MHDQLIDPNVAQQFEKLPPHSIDAEMCVLASMMLAGDNRKIYSETVAGLSREAFFQVDHQIIFEVVTTLVDRGKVDAVIVRAELDRRQLLEECGGTQYLAAILSTIPCIDHGPYYAAIVREKYRLRLLIATGNEITRDAYAPAAEDNASSLALKHGAQLAEIASTAQKHQIITLGEAVEQFIAEQDNPTDASRRINTGISDLDNAIGGLARGELTIVGGRASMGKSQLIKQVVGNVAGTGIRCGIVAVEEGRRKIVANYLSAFSGIENNLIAQGRANDREWGQINLALLDVQKLPIYLLDTAFALGDIIGAIRQLVLTFGCSLIAVDHLHLIDGENERDNRNNEVSGISRALKQAFRELNVASLVAAQLNRGGDGPQSSRKPVLRDLRDSGSLEQDGDLILLLHREDYYRYAEPDYRSNHQLEVLIAKNKSGSPCHIPLHFDGAHQRVMNWNNDPAPSAGPF